MLVTVESQSHEQKISTDEKVCTGHVARKQQFNFLTVVELWNIAGSDANQNVNNYIGK